MRVILDHREVGGVPPTAGPSEAVQFCARLAGSEGRLVVCVVADGVQVADYSKLGTVNELSLTTAESGAVLVDAIEAATDMLEQCRALQTSAADAMMEGRIDDGTRCLQGVMECWGGIHRATVQIEQFDINSKARDSGSQHRGTNAADLGDQLAGSLRGLKGFIAKEDWSAAADVLGVDLVGLCDKWRTHLAACKESTLKGAAR